MKLIFKFIYGAFLIFILGLAISNCCPTGPGDDILGKSCSDDVQCFGYKCINGLCQKEGMELTIEPQREPLAEREKEVGEERGRTELELVQESPDEPNFERRGEGVGEKVFEEVFEDGGESVVETSPKELPPKECSDGESRRCYTKKLGCKDKGDGTFSCTSPCAPGYQICVNGYWSRCVGEVIPEKEICDGRDNDCDGKVDEGVKGCVQTVAGIPPDKVDTKISNNFSFDPKNKHVYFKDREKDIIYRYDYYQNSFVEVFRSAGIGNDDGPFGKATFDGIGPLAFDPKKLVIYTTDRKGKVFRRIDLINREVKTIAGSGREETRDGSFADGSFTFVHGMALSPDGKILYFTEKHCVRKLDFIKQEIKTVAGNCSKSGYRDGPFQNALFFVASGLSFDDSGNLIVAEPGGGRIRKLDFTRGVVSTIAGSVRGYVDGPVSKAKLYTPTFAYYYRGRTIFVEPSLNLVREVAGGIVSTIAGNRQAGFRDGPALNASFYGPFGLFPVNERELVIIDLLNNRLRKLDRTFNFVTTIFGNGPPGFKNGFYSESLFFIPFGIELISKDLYIADSFNHCIRKLSLTTKKVSTFAGICRYKGNQDGPIHRAYLNTPRALAFDQKGKKLYVAQPYSIKVIDFIKGTVKTVAGTPGKIGYKEGSGTTALFNSIIDITFNGQGELLISDSGNHCIRKLDPKTNTVSRFAGQCGKRGYKDGPSNQATFDLPNGLLFYRGEVYVADYLNHCIRKIDKMGNVSTFVGKCSEHGVINGSLLQTRLYYPTDIAADDRGNFYITELSSLCFRKVSGQNVSALVGKCGELSELKDGPIRKAKMGKLRSIIYNPINKSIFLTEPSLHRVIELILP